MPRLYWHPDRYGIRGTDGAYDATRLEVPIALTVVLGCFVLAGQVPVPFLSYLLACTWYLLHGYVLRRSQYLQI